MKTFDPSSRQQSFGERRHGAGRQWRDASLAPTPVAVVAEREPVSASRAKGRDRFLRPVLAVAVLHPHTLHRALDDRGAMLEVGT